MKIAYPRVHTLIASNISEESNRDYMFDEFIDTQTTYSDLIRVTLVSSEADFVVLFNIDADEIELTLINTDIYVESEYLKIAEGDNYLEIDASETYLSIERPSVSSWVYDMSDKQSLLAPIYLYPSSNLQIDIKKSGGTAKCGICRVATSKEIGVTLEGIEPSIVDYSIKDTDESGYTILSQGAWARRLSGDIVIENTAIDELFFALVEARGQLVGVEVNGVGEDFDSLAAYGYFEKWEIILDQYETSTCSFKFKGVI